MPNPQAIETVNWIYVLSMAGGAFTFHVALQLYNNASRWSDGGFDRKTLVQFCMETAAVTLFGGMYYFMLKPLTGFQAVLNGLMAGAAPSAVINSFKYTMEKREAELLAEKVTAMQNAVTELQEGIAEIRKASGE